MTDTDLEFVRDLIKNNRYLTLATSDGSDPWIAPLEYISDDALNLYFFSLENSLHAQHIQDNKMVAVAIFDSQQPEYQPGKTLQLSGVQIAAVARKLKGPLPAIVNEAINLLQPPMPPYAVFEVKPHRAYLPLICDGLNERKEVQLK